MQNKMFVVLVFVASIIILNTSGIRMSLGLFIEPITKDTLLSVRDMSLSLAVMQLLWGVSQPLMGALSDRYGAYKVLNLGTFLLVCGLVLAPNLSTKLGFTFTLGLLVAFGTGAGSFSVLMSQVANQIVPKFRGLASGIINAGSSFGQFLFAPLIGFLIATPNISWSGAFYVLAAISLACLPLSYFLTRDIKAKTNSQDNDEKSLKEVLLVAIKDRSYWLLHIGFFTCGFHIAFLATHLPLEIMHCGHSLSTAGTSISLIGLSNVVGSLFVGWCVGHFRSKYILFWMYISRALLIIIYLYVEKTATNFMIFSVGMGLTWLATVPPTAAAVGKLFGVKYLATLFGFVLFTHQVGAFFGAYLGGVAFETLSDYTWMWYADIVLATMAGILSLPIREPNVKS